WACASMASVTRSGSSRFRSALARGRSTATRWVRTGMVIMKMISITSITSINGTMLISLSSPSSSSNSRTEIPMLALRRGERRGRVLVLASARAGSPDGMQRTAMRRRAGGPARERGFERMARQEVAAQLSGESAQLAAQGAIGTAQRVVAEHRGDRHRQAEGGHDERLPDRTGDLVDARLLGDADAEQRVVDPPDGAAQAHEGRRRADRREHRQPGAQALAA